jgi:hypothetical protein
MGKQPQTDIGLRRVSWVHVTVCGDDAHAVAHGIGHRLPRAVPIPMETAAALAGRGVPALLRRIDGDPVASEAR